MAGNRIPGTVFRDIQVMQALLGGLGFKLITRLGFKGAFPGQGSREGGWMMDNSLHPSEGFTQPCKGRLLVRRSGALMAHAGKGDETQARLGANQCASFPAGGRC